MVIINTEAQTAFTAETFFKFSSGSSFGENTVHKADSFAACGFETSGGVKMLDDDVILKYTDEELPYLKDYSVIKAKTSKNINEVGIFRVEDGHAKELEAIIRTFLEHQQESFRGMNYFPEEIEKIDCATVKVYGNYVVYSFLNEVDTEAFYAAIEKEITK